MMKSVLITGVTGFIGRYLARQFAGKGWRIVGLGLEPPENAPIQDLDRYHQMVLPCADLAGIVQREQTQLCIHCAGRASVEFSLSEPRTDFIANVEVPFNVLDTLRRQAPTCRFILLSSAAVYGNPQHLPINEDKNSPGPISPYGFHKLLSEQLCAEFFKVYGLPTAVVRIFSAYGPGLRRQVIWDICKKALTQSVLRLRGTGEESRDFIHGRDIARGILLLAEHAEFAGEIYNLASGAETTIRQLADLIIAQIDGKITVEFDGANPPGNPRNWRANISRMVGLGFRPEVSLAEGIRLFVKWARLELQDQ